jgi:hypothetical protein
MRKKIGFLFIVLFSAVISLANAHAGTEDLSDVLDMLEEPALPRIISPTCGTMQDPGVFENPVGLSDMIRFTGELSLFAAFPVDGRKEEGKGDYKDISRLNTGLRLDMDLRPEEPWHLHAGIRASYDAVPCIKGRANYSDEYLADGESELELHEAYISAWPLRKLDLKIGRQIVAWGTSESMRVVDVLNPVDKREPGQTDIEDLRLPVFMTRMDFFPNTTWSVTSVVVNETRFDKEPPWGSEFYTGKRKFPGDDESEFALKNQELALALTGRFKGWDMTLNGAWFLDDIPYWSGNERNHARATMLGGTVQVALGNWLFKGEGGFFTGLRSLRSPNEEYARADLLVGTEYSCFEETIITVEFLNRHIPDWDGEVIGSFSGLRRNDTSISLRLERDCQNDTLHFLGAGVFSLPPSRGGMGRVEISCDLDDDIRVRAGYALYLGGDEPRLDALDGNDRIFTEISYSF